jgi:hypothetical protein
MPYASNAKVPSSYRRGSLRLLREGRTGSPRLHIDRSANEDANSFLEHPRRNRRKGISDLEDVALVLR